MKCMRFSDFNTWKSYLSASCTYQSQSTELIGDKNVHNHCSYHKYQLEEHVLAWCVDTWRNGETAIAGVK